MPVRGDVPCDSACVVERDSCTVAAVVDGPTQSGRVARDAAAVIENHHSAVEYASSSVLIGIPRNATVSIEDGYSGQNGNAPGTVIADVAAAVQDGVRIENIYPDACVPDDTALVIECDPHTKREHARALIVGDAAVVVEEDAPANVG